MKTLLTLLLFLAVVVLIACSTDETRQQEQTSPDTKGYVLKHGEGEALGPDRLIKASPNSGTQGSVVVLDELPRVSQPGSTLIPTPMSSFM